MKRAPGHIDTDSKNGMNEIMPFFFCAALGRRFYIFFSSSRRLILASR